MRIEFYLFLEDSMATFGNDYINSKASTDVNVVGFAGNALDGILKAIQESKKAINDLAGEIGENADQQDKKDAKDKVASVASERRQRAAYAAIHGKVDKGLSAIGVLTDALKDIGKKILDMLGDGFKQSLRSFSDLAKTMRKEKLTKEQKNAVGAAARESVKSTSSSYGIQVSENTANEAMVALIQKGLVSSIGRMSKEVRDGYVALVASGVDAQEAYNKAMTLKTEQIQKEVLARSDSMVKGVIAGLNSRISDVERLKLGGANDASQKILEVSTGFAKTVGGFMSDESMADLGKIFLDFKSGNFAGMDQKAVETALSVFAGGVENIGNLTAEQLGESIRKRVQEAGGDQSKLEELSRHLYILQKGQVGDGKILNEIAVGVQMAQKDKNSLGRDVRNEAQNKQALSENTENGKFKQAISEFVSSMDSVTGGFLTKVANGIDEYFGEDLTLEQLVSSGFSTVCKFLAVIAGAWVISKGSGLLSSLITGASSLTGLAGLAGLGKAATGGAEAASKAATGGAEAASKAATKPKLLAKMAPYLKKTGIGLALVGGGTLLGSTLSDSDGDAQPQSDTTGMPDIGGDYYSNMLRLVSDIRNAVCNVSGSASNNGRPLNEPNENLDLARGIANSFTSPIETAGVKMGEKFAKKVAPDAVARASEKAALKAAEKAAERAAMETAETAGAAVAKAGLKTALKGAGKVLGPAGALVDAGITVYEVSQDLAEADRQEQAGKDLSFELFAKQLELNKAKKSGDADAIARLTSEIGTLENAIDSAAIAQEAATDQAVVHGVSGVTGIGGAFAGAALGAAVGSVVPVIGTAIGGVVGGIIGGIGGMMAGDAAASAAVADTPEQRAEKIRQKREAYQAELQAMGNKASEKGISESVALALIASTKDKAAFENKLDGIAQMQKLGLNEVELEFLAESAKNADEMQALAKQMLTDPNKIYGNVGSIAVDISAMRTNLMSIYHRIEEIELGLKSTFKFASGGIVTSATPAVIGEAGKEVVLPLERPADMAKVIGQLSPSEKLSLLRILFGKRQSITMDLMNEALASVLGATDSSQVNSILASLPTSSVPGDDPATINKILDYAGPARAFVYDRLLHGWKGNYADGFKQRKKWYSEALANAANQEGRDLIRGTYAERALDFGISELGKPYILRSLGKIGYVCNEFVNACLRASGFDMGKFWIWGVKNTFANINKGKMSGKDYPNFRIRNDLTPETAIPGMVFFQDSRKNKEGGFQPGHIGLVYYGNQKLHSSGGSKDFSKEGFLTNWQTPCRGVTVTPFDGNDYVIGEFPGLFEQATGEWKKPVSSPVPFGPSQANITPAVNKAPGILSDTEINEILSEAGVSNSAAMKQYIEQAKHLSGNANNKGDIIAVLLEIARYLKGIAASPANKPPMMSVARPYTPAYGT